MFHHNHHRIPKHMKENPHYSNDNLERLSVDEHAESHMWLWFWFGQTEDYIAWQSLSGKMTEEEARILAVKNARTGLKLSDKTKKLMSESCKRAWQSDEIRAKRCKPRRPRSPEHCRNMSLAKKGKPSGAKGRKGQVPWNKGITTGKPAWNKGLKLQNK